MGSSAPLTLNLNTSKPGLVLFATSGARLSLDAHGRESQRRGGSTEGLRIVFTSFLRYTVILVISRL